MKNCFPTRNRLLLVVALFMCALTTSLRTCSYTYEETKILRAFSSAGNGCYDLNEAKALCATTSDCSGITIQPQYCSGSQWTLRKHELNPGVANSFSWVRGDCTDGGVVDNTDCPTGFVGLAGTNKCYQFNNNVRSQEDAKTYCQSLGAKLPVVESIEENAFIASQTGWTGTVWIGLQKPTDDGTWAWENAGVNSFSNWLNVNEPYLLPGELCSAIWTTDYNFAWNAATCNLGTVKTVCEADREPPVREICEYTFVENQIVRGWTSAGPDCFDMQDAKALCARTADCTGITIQPEYCGGSQYTLRKFELNPGTSAGTFSWVKGTCSDGGAQDDTDCPTGYVGLAGTNKCYHYDSNVRSEADAKTFCQGMGGKLPIVESIEENAFIVKQTGWTGLVWIGQTKPTDDGAWTWENIVSNPFTNWLNVNEPYLLPGEHCSAIWREAYNFAWNAAVCNLGTVKTVCEAERAPPVREICEYSFEEGKIVRGWTSAGTGCYDLHHAKALCSRTADCNGITVQPEYCSGARWTLRKFELNPGSSAGTFSWFKGDCSDGETVESTDCPDGFVGLAGTTKCYHYDNNVRSQQDANTFCQGMGGTLPIVESIEENAFIAKQTGWTGLVWIGQTKPTDDAAWVWENSVSNSFTNWLNVNEPYLLPGELCSAIWSDGYNFAWNAAVCNLGTVKTICEAHRVPAPACPMGFNLLAGTNKCYRNFPGQLGQHSWGQAKSFCEGLGAKLPVVTSAAENQFIVDQTGGAGIAWIGFSDQAQEGTWVWANDEVNAYTNWIPNEPQDFIPEENCATIWTPEHQFRWNGYPCSGMRGHRNIIHTVCETVTAESCPVHYTGGCSGSRGINKYQDKAYTVAECADKCRAETEPCVGFFVDKVRYECLTAKAGCSNNGDTRMNYYLIDECPATEPEPVWDCPETYHGGCSLGGSTIIRHLKDRTYTASQCGKLCQEEATCGGFFLGRSDARVPSFIGSCMLVLPGCENDHNPDWNYYAKDTCRRGTYSVVNYDVTLTGTGLDCNALAHELKFATAAKLGVPANQINVDQSGCSRRRRRLTQEYRFTVEATVPSTESEDVHRKINSQEFNLDMSRMLHTAFETVDGAEFTGFELNGTEQELPTASEPETDNTSVPLAAGCGAVGGAALMVGAYFAFKKDKVTSPHGQDRV